MLDADFDRFLLYEQDKWSREEFPDDEAAAERERAESIRDDEYMDHVRGLDE